MFPLRVSDIQINIKARLIGPINLQIEQNGISIRSAQTDRKNDFIRSPSWFEKIIC